MAKTKNKPEGDTDKWLSPKEALKIAQGIHGDNAAKIFMDRLRADFLPGIAFRWSDVTEGEEPQVSDEPTPVPASFWMKIQDEGVFWCSGDARFFFHDSIYPNRTVRCTDIRFLAKTIHEQFPVPKPAPPTPGEIRQPSVPETKGKPVAAAHLAKWATLYVEVYPESEDTGDKAWESAKGMFQGKSVSRDAARQAVAAIRPRTRGRKRTSE